MTSDPRGNTGMPSEAATTDKFVLPTTSRKDGTGVSPPLWDVTEGNLAGSRAES
ncbi:hypothetical protein [Gordonia oryzae]|uniref:hypothetical protein n=1 Tax=Gordonia oryzae TaxID=2487349 RepID=UPI001FE34B54|nr:hypothetical protein [Gordonia oryzae]